MPAWKVDTVAIAESRHQMLMGFGAFYFMGAQLGSVLAVLPFLLVSEGISWAAGLVVPSFSVGFIIGNALSSFMVKRSRRRQHVIIAAASAAIAVLTAFVAPAALHNVIVVYVFVAAATLIGATIGCGEQCLRRDHLAHAYRSPA